MINGLFDKPRLWLAPLAGYTDQAYRQICKEWGAEILVSEMVSADGLIRDSAKTAQYITFLDTERPFGIQIFGSEPYVMAKAAEFLIPYKPDFIDINMGCPVKKVVRRGAGSALMQTPEKAAVIVKEVQNALAGSIPFSVKFRSGWDNSSLNFLYFGLMMQDSGADFVTLHPRTSRQMFGGLSNWEHIKALKARLNIPVVGNGDLHSPEDAERMLNETRCDGLMIGRGALGKPWIFRQCREFLTSGSYTPITKNHLLETVVKHLELALQYQREAVVVKEMRSQLCFYTKGQLGGAEIRNKINHAESAEELRQILRHML
ncbi:tRNA dihydrouridine synthase DusB [Candidatus Cloacimonadaceae bacterium]